MARPICLRLLVHCARRAASRADCTAGNNRAIRTAMMAITTSSSIKVKPREAERLFMAMSLEKKRKMRDCTSCQANSSQGTEDREHRTDRTGRSEAVEPEVAGPDSTTSRV